MVIKRKQAMRWLPLPLTRLWLGAPIHRAVCEPLRYTYWHSSCGSGEYGYRTEPHVCPGNVGAGVAAVKPDRDRPGDETLPPRLRQRRHGAHAMAGAHGATRNADQPAQIFGPRV